MTITTYDYYRRLHALQLTASLIATVPTVLLSYFKYRGMFEGIPSLGFFFVASLVMIGLAYSIYCQVSLLRVKFPAISVTETHLLHNDIFRRRIEIPLNTIRKMESNGDGSILEIWLEYSFQADWIEDPYQPGASILLSDLSITARELQHEIEERIPPAKPQFADLMR